MFISYSGYLLFAFLSIIVAINPIESFVRIGQLLTFFFSFGVLLFLFNRGLLKLNDLLWLSFFTLFVDMAFSLEQYVFMIVNEIPYKYDFITNLVGLQGNRNILATTIAFRIPLVILLAKKIKKYYLFFFIFNLIAFYNIILLSSRATLLAIGLSTAFLIVAGLIIYFKKEKDIFKNNSYSFFLYLLPFIIAFQVSTYTIDPDDQSYVSSRISTITSSDDESKNTRIRYYTQSINHILKNPLLGGGVGNWKILSIKYDAENIQNYIVPYNAHNDILEATAETGIIGGAFFVAFFFFLFYEIIKIYKKENKEAYDIQSKIILTIPFIIYMIDLNLNFPSHRPTNLYLLLIYIFIVLLINESIKGEKK